MSHEEKEDPSNFSLVLGGPLYQLFLRTRLAAPPLLLLRRRILAFSLITWVPPLLFSILAGTFYQGVKVPFLYDISTHVRFLIAMPLLVYAEVIFHQHLKPIVNQFTARGIVPPADRAKFDAYIDSALRFRNSIVVEIILLLLSFTIGHFVWRQATSLKAATWYAAPTSTGFHITYAGLWYACISMPLFQFLLYRWLYRWGIWARFLWQVSRLTLHIIPTHPDRSGGLGFLGDTSIVFAPILMGAGAALSGVIAGKIFFDGASLLDFKFEIGGLALFLCAMVLAPLCVFSPDIANARRWGNWEYGALASRYMDEFDQKWNHKPKPSDEPLLGSGDIQSLADMGNSYTVLRDMTIVPFDRRTVITVVATIIVPIAPLILTLIPMNELIGKLLRLLF